LAILFMAAIAIVCARNPALGPAGAKTPWAERLRSLIGLLDTLILFIVVIGGLFIGFFSPTQAGAIGAAGALVIGLARRKISWKGFVGSSKDAVRTSCMVLFIFTGAIIFGKFMAVSTIPFTLGTWVAGLPLSPTAVIVVIILIYFIGGCLMDSLPLIVLTIPIFYPVVQLLGFDTIWFGVIIVMVANMGLITPPVGNNVFVVKGISEGVSLGTIFKGVVPFVVAIVVAVVIIIAVPEIATWLPSFIN